ncbi:PQQ-dependent sugar dehydrogenase [Leeia sp. TBRC 13508]|uniref:PQQ-dependent sugar dehydrogenase n=1 Tax=Leeia speluncae TaxID=2884804 RepID=A0ABS8D8H1_9NEIS|nr:PQQ-dependent sugar dehydrogenase [Leeia speluncae]MCB6184422.1 PQQ-dependent sugar dehydrogenase [Leeia speluncae]
MIKKLIRTTSLTTIFMASAHVMAAGYPTSGTCDGFPKINVTTPAGFCVGLVAEGFTFPRGILPLANGEALLVDMGGWQNNKGSIWKLKFSGGKTEKTKLLDKIDRPHGVIQGPDGMAYVGYVGGVFRFNPLDSAPKKEDLIGGSSALPALPSTGRHPLVSLLFNKEGDLLVNTGSESDNCDSAAGQAICKEAEGKEARGVVRKYKFDKPGGKLVEWSVFASGLRNSVALALHAKSGQVWQGENSRDAIGRKLNLPNDNDLPHDEINQLVAGTNYGWPYCYDNQLASPEFPKYDCKKTTAPAKLLPGHAAPLGMIFYTGKQFPAEYAGNLIVGFHGYRDNGHRLVSFKTNDQGAPQGNFKVLIDGWGAKGAQPMGAPVDVRMASDGSLLMTEDRNADVLRMVYVGK